MVMFNPFKMFRNPYYCYRFSRRLAQLRIPILPSFIDYYVRWFFACWLPHTATIGEGFNIGYGGLGCVIHSKCVVGDHVHIGTQVTLGGNARQEGIPTIGNHVFIGTGAKILGPVTVGDGAVIGANSVVTRDVPSRSVVAGMPAKVIHENIDINEYLFHLRSKS